MIPMYITTVDLDQINSTKLLHNKTLQLIEFSCPQQRESLEPVMSPVDTMTHHIHTRMHTHPSVLFLEAWWILYLQLEYLCDPFIFPSQRQREKREGSPWHRGCKQNNKITAVTGRSTHLSRSSRQWHLLGNWGCQSASPAELLCSSCSSLTEPLQNRQRTEPPETSGKKEWNEKKERERNKDGDFTLICTGVFNHKRAHAVISRNYHS